MTEWLTQLSSFGLPWYAAFVLILLTVLCTKGVDALLKLRRNTADEKLKEIDRLTARLTIVEQNFDKDREAAEKKFDKERDARLECVQEISFLKGRMEQVTADTDLALRRHRENNEAHIAKLKELENAVNKKQIDVNSEKIRELEQQVNQPDGMHDV